jgi:hypothetical protein
MWGTTSHSTPVALLTARRTASAQPCRLNSFTACSVDSSTAYLFASVTSAPSDDAIGDFSNACRESQQGDPVAFVGLRQAMAEKMGFLTMSAWL